MLEKPDEITPDVKGGAPMSLSDVAQKATAASEKKIRRISRLTFAVVR